MALNVARGVFRLWVALSIVWIGGVVAMTWWTFPVDDWVPVFNSAKLAATPEPKPPFDPDAYLAGKPQPMTNPAELPDAPWVLKQLAQTHAIQFGTTLALVPPALSLVFGLFAGWVVRGFMYSK